MSAESDADAHFSHNCSYARLFDRSTDIPFYIKHQAIGYLFNFGNAASLPSADSRGGGSAIAVTEQIIHRDAAGAHQSSVATDIAGAVGAASEASSLGCIYQFDSELTRLGYAAVTRKDVPETTKPKQEFWLSV
ncbi:MAG: hypothetical protein Q8Q81_11545 [Oxalobacteraceae bacterium]|nr:hypothetical protein [Oxalobacteraceae bacterium]